MKNGQPKFVLYFQLSTLLDTHIKKDMEIALSFSQMGYASTLIVGRVSTSNLSNYYFRQVRVIPTGNTRSNKMLNLRSYAKEFWKLFAFFDKHRPNVVLVIHAWIISPIVIAAYKIKNEFSKTKLNNRTKFVLKLDSDGRMYSSGSLRPFWRLILLLNSFAFDRIIIETQSGYDRIKNYVFFKRKLLVIPSGYSGVTYKRVVYGASKRDPIILCAARIVRDKGIDVLIKAFGRVHSSFPDWHVIITGEVQDRAYYKELLDLAKSYGIENKFTFLGYVSEDKLKSLYLRSMIFCLPSRAEGFPAVISEAVASGLPLITSEAGCGMDIAEHGALVVPIADVQALAGSLFQVMSNEDLRKSISEKLQRHIISWQEIAHKIAMR